MRRFLIAAPFSTVDVGFRLLFMPFVSSAVVVCFLSACRSASFLTLPLSLHASFSIFIDNLLISFGSLSRA